MSPLEILGQYFTTGTAEAEEKILPESFVPVADYVQIINPPHASPRILVARKGSGKSAFLQVLSNKMVEQNIPVLLIRPEDIVKTDPPPDASSAVLVSNAEEQLCMAIAVQAGSQLRGLVTGEDQEKLLKLAEAIGAKPRDVIQRLMDGLIPIAKLASSIDFTPIAKAFNSPKPKEIERAILTSLGKDGKIFYLLIDDTDRVATPSIPNHLNRIWAFLLAARNICRRNPYLRCIITLRTEVWYRLSRDNASQRDQVDHFRPLLHFLNPSEDDVARIIEHRFHVAADAAKKEGNIISSDYGTFFEGERVKIPTSTEERFWHSFIIKRSRERPRDAVQLVALLCKHAITKKANKIDGLDVEMCMPQYSTERVEDLKREVDSECPQIKEVIATFSNIKYSEGAFKADAETLKKHFLSLPSRFSIQLFGVALKPANEEDAFKLWRFLFDIGFFGGRTDDASARDGYTHVMLGDDKDLVSVARWTDMKRIQWEVNPAYRDFLIQTHERETGAIFKH